MKNRIQLLCNERTRLRECYYGTFYRTELTVDGITGAADILWIKIPFSPHKEAELMRRFRISRDDLPEYYADFRNNIRNHIELASEIEENGPDALVKSTVQYRSVLTESEPEDDGSIQTDIFLVTEPMSAYGDSDIYNLSGTTLAEVCRLGVRLLQTAKSMWETGRTIGVADLDSYYVTEPREGKPLLKNGYLLYATEGCTKPRYTADSMGFVEGDIRSGAQEQSSDTDAQMIARLLWGLLDGRHHSVTLDLSHAPRYADEALAAVLSGVLRNGAGAVKELQGHLRSLGKRIADGETENTIIPFAVPAYMLLPLPSERPKHAAIPHNVPENMTEGAERHETQRRQRQRAVLAGLAAAVFVMTAVLGSVCFRTEDAGSPSTSERPLSYTEKVEAELTDELYLEDPGDMWRLTYRFTATPRDISNPVFTLVSSDPSALRFLVSSNGEEVLAEGVRLKTDSAGDACATVIGMKEGQYEFVLTAEDGGYTAILTAVFAIPEPEETPDNPSPEEDELNPSPTLEPVPEPEVSAVPAPTAAPVPEKSSSGGGDTVLSPAVPAVSVAASEATPVPTAVQTQQPEITPVPVFEVDYPKGKDGVLNLKVGDRINLYPTESCTIRVSGQGIIRINNATMELEALEEGECEVVLICTLSGLKGERVEIPVRVTA